MATYEQAFQETKEYFSGDELSAKVFVDKYALVDNEGSYQETNPDQTHQRLARELSRIESKYPNSLSQETIYGLLKNFKFVIPQGSPISAIGNPYRLESLSNCFVVPIEGDSYGAIFKADQMLAQLMKRRGGVGLDVSTLRPDGSLTSNAARSSSGIGPFMERFSNTCREVAQSGRRGAEMITISVHHPEIETFINIKRDKLKVTGANISIRLTDEFMKAVVANEEYQQRFPVDEKKKPKISKMVSAKAIWDQIVDSAWACAEPGLLFWDNVIRWSPADSYSDFQTISTNPCSELPLSAYDACRLLVVNLMGFVSNPFTKDAKFDWKLYDDVCQKAQRLMDDIVDLEIEAIDKILAKVENDPESEEVKREEKELWGKIRRSCENGRRTGLGVTAVGDLLASLGVRYGSDESLELVERVYEELCLSSYRSSVQMADERGTFGSFDFETEKNNDFLNRVWEADPELYKEYQKHGRRNIANLTTAPVGSISMLARLTDNVFQVTSGIESAFLLNFTRRKKINPSDKNAKVDFTDDSGDKWSEFNVFHPGFSVWMKVNKKTKEEVAESPYFKATSADLDWKAGVLLQARAQKWIDHAISRTTNLPREATRELVSEIYLTAWESGCKGFTVYREGCRSGVLVSNTQPETFAFTPHEATKRPERLSCDIHHVKVQGEAWAILVGLLDSKPYEIFGGEAKFVSIPKKYNKGFIQKVKKKGAKHSQYNLLFNGENDEDPIIIKDIVKVFENQNYASLSRMLSLSLRHGAKVNYVVEQLSKDDNEDLYAFNKVIARVLKTYIPDGTASTDKKCSSCGAEGSLVYQEGCVSCKSCGFSKCG